MFILVSDFEEQLMSKSCWSACLFYYLEFFFIIISYYYVVKIFYGNIKKIKKQMMPNKSHLTMEKEKCLFHMFFLIKILPDF